MGAEVRRRFEEKFGRAVDIEDLHLLLTAALGSSASNTEVEQEKPPQRSAPEEKVCALTDSI